MNQYYLVGRIIDFFIQKDENTDKVTEVKIAVTRSFKNTDGIYETDFINNILIRGIANNVMEYCSKGDLIAIKGNIQSKMIEVNSKQVSIPQLVADKVTFLSTSIKGEKANV
ncbi:MAG: single-stranded DNA-binding protein [Erysipelotrichaceae bacterium]|nr:single-stranded DNA-binding protein [Erysipelotrichaceae bacterium]